MCGSTPRPLVLDHALKKQPARRDNICRICVRSCMTEIPGLRTGRNAHIESRHPGPDPQAVAMDCRSASCMSSLEVNVLGLRRSREIFRPTFRTSLSRIALNASPAVIVSGKGISPVSNEAERDSVRRSGPILGRCCGCPSRIAFRIAHWEKQTLQARTS